MKLQLTPSLVLTTEHDGSRYEIPVLVKRDGTAEQTAYGPSEMLEYARITRPAAMHVLRFFRLFHPDVQRAHREAVSLFLSQWPAGPQL